MNENTPTSPAHTRRRVAASLAVVVLALTTGACDDDDKTSEGEAPRTVIETAGSTTADAAEQTGPTDPTTPPTDGGITDTSTGSPSAAVQLLGADTWLACQCGTGEFDQIFLFRPDGADEQLVFDEFDGFVRHPDFSHDGQRLAFDHLEADEPGVPDELWSADADGSNPTRVGVPCSLEDCLGVWEPAWSPDDRQLAAIASGGPLTATGPASFAVVVIDLEASTMRVVYEQPGSDGQLQFPRWSPDGTQLTFWNETDTPTTWIVNADGTGVRQMTSPELLAGDPDWSPDGTTLVVSTKPLVHFPEGPSDLYLVPLDGATPTQLTDSASTFIRYTQPRWTPDGDAIVYTRESGQGRKVWIRSLDGTVEGPLGSTQPIQTHPIVRPAS